MKSIKIIFIASLIFSLGFYLDIHLKHSSAQSKLQFITVSPEPIKNTLFYAGIIQPIKIASVSSLADGVIEKMVFHYGDSVAQGQLLFIISSEKFHSEYESTMMQYIKSRSDFIENQNQLKKSNFLHKNQLISDDEFNSKKTGFYNAQLELIHSRSALAALLRELDLRDYSVYNLKIEDIDKITQLLQSKNGSQQLKIVSPAAGVILQPPKGDNPDGELKKIVLGDLIKAGDNLGVIGDQDGLMIHVNVSEFNINQLKIGQKAEVSGSAFPGLILEGKISNVNRQGESGQNGIPTFSVDVSVPHLTREQHAVVRLGMTVKVAISIDEGKKITVPVSAVYEKNNQFYVQVLDQPSGKIKEVAIKVGKTLLDSVIVESNLAPGEKIVLSH